MLETATAFLPLDAARLITGGVIYVGRRLPHYRRPKPEIFGPSPVAMVLCNLHFQTRYTANVAGRPLGQSTMSTFSLYPSGCSFSLPEFVGLARPALQRVWPSFFRLD